DDRLKSDTYDAQGNTLTSNCDTYTYDFENRLTGVKQDAKASSNAVTLVYDGDGNRVMRTDNAGTTLYVVDDQNPTGYAQVLEDLKASTVKSAYTYGRDLISEK